MPCVQAGFQDLLTSWGHHGGAGQSPVFGLKTAWFPGAALPCDLEFMVSLPVLGFFAYTLRTVLFESQPCYED